MDGVSVGGMDSGTLELSTGDHLVHDYNQIKSYQRYCRMVSSCITNVICLQKGVLLIKVLTALMRFIILDFTLTSCCPP